MTQKIIWCLIAGMLGMGSGLWAQDEASKAQPTTLLDTSFLMGPLKTKKFSHYFREKGTVILTVTPKDKPVLYIEVMEHPGIHQYSAFKAAEVKGQEIKNEAHTRFNFKFKNGSIGYRYVQIKIEHVLAPLEMPLVLQDTIYTDTIYGNTVFIDTTRFLPVRDCTIIAGRMVKETQVELWPREDRRQRYRDQKLIRAELPTDKLVTGWAYWIGVGQGAATHFDELSNRLPEDWIAEGVTTPLHAYAKGLLPTIPRTNLGESVEYAIVSEDEALTFGMASAYDSIPGYRKRDAIVDFGKFEVKGKTNPRIYLWVANPNQVIGLTVYVKVLALYKDETLIEQAIRQSNQ